MAFQRLGSTTIDLYGVATAEIHVLADVQDGVAERIYWIQFEGVRADNDHIYDYGGEPWCVEIDGRAFHAGPSHYPRTELTEASESSDSRTVVELIPGGRGRAPRCLGPRPSGAPGRDGPQRAPHPLSGGREGPGYDPPGRLDADEAHRDRVFETLRDGLRLRPAPR